MKLKHFLLAAALGAAPLGANAAVVAPAVAAIPGVKNIIVIINDGAGFTVYDATRLYQGGPLVTDGAGFKTASVSTFPIRPDASAGKVPPSPGNPTSPADVDNNKPGSTSQDNRTVYDPNKFWDTTTLAGPSQVAGYTTPFAQAGFSPITDLYPAAFLGYEYSRFAHPDSGNTATSLSSGVKSYNNAINVNGAGEPQMAIVDAIAVASSVGKATGVVTTVEFADATPAALGGAHNIARANHYAIANEMFQAGRLNVIGGTGNPDYDDDGNLRATPVYAPVGGPGGGWISQALWTDLKANTNSSGFNPNLFKLVQDRAGIQAIANGTVKPPSHLAMIMHSFVSSQFNRTNILKRADGVTPIDAREDMVYGTPLKTDVPTQAELTVAALKVLDQNGRGFYLMSEAGAVDRAEHANDTARMIEETIASEDTVKAIIDFVNSKRSAATWNNTLLIVTADHDHLFYGPDGATVAFEPLQDKGAGKIPGNRWFGPNHGTGLVPLFAYGKGADKITSLGTKVDTYTDAQGHKYGHGVYVDQTTLGQVLKLTAAQAK